MYAEFNNIDDLFNAVKEDKQADGVNSVTLNRYPMRFVLFDNFRDSYAFIIRMMQEMKVSMEEVQHWLDPDYPDYIISHSRLADEMGKYFKALKGESKIITPFSELARFYDNDAKKQFDALIKTIKGFECLQEGWDKKQRIYIPIVGLEGKMSTFFSDTQTTIWYLRAENQELNYRLILTDRTTYGVQNLESQYTIVKNVAEWLDFWRNKDYHEKPNIICSSRSIYANACYAQPDNAFTYCTCGSVYEFLNKGLGLSFSDIQYKEKDEEYWKELAKEVDLQSQFDFNVFFSRHFSMTQVEDYKAFIKLWFEYNDGFSYGNWGGYNLLVKLNQRNPEVQQYHYDTVRFWVEQFDIDGIRLDAADVLDFEGVQTLAKNYPNTRAGAFFDWFSYADNTIDGQSRKKAYDLFETGIVTPDNYLDWLI